MPVPTSYTEDTLADYMRTGVLRKTAEVLRWQVTADYQEAINQTLIDYGVTNIEDASDIVKLRVLARMNAWRSVTEANVPSYQATADGATFHRDQIYDHAKEQFLQAQYDASPYLNRVVRTSSTNLELQW